MSDEKHVNEWLPAYALNILSQEETTQVVEHLATCPTCRDELRAYQGVVDELPLALVETAPHPALKDQLMREIRSRHARVRISPQPNLWQQLVSYVRHNFPVWSLALIVVLALGNWILWRRLNQVSNLGATPMHVVALADTKDSPGATGVLTMSQNGEYGTLVVDNLVALDASHQYQIWLKQGEQRISGGIFSVNSTGYASLEIEAPQPLSHYQAIGITIEPAGGSVYPTGAKVLGGELQPKP